MRLQLVPGLLIVLLMGTALSSSASKAAGSLQQPAVYGSVPDVAAIIRAFTTKETEFRQALNQYAFKRDATVQTVGLGGEITGEYHRVSQFVFDDQGNRYEKITYFPTPTLTEISVTQEDIDDLGGIQPLHLRHQN